MSWKFNSTEAIFIQIAKQIRRDIICGKYSPDEQIPSVRQLAYDAAVNPNTMQKALALLEEEGLLYTKGTVGRFITSDAAILDDAKKKMRHYFIVSWLDEARAIGITPQELTDHINQLQKEDSI